ncbi:alkaline phosphatase D family protein [Candidatus Laterigemmans baculatus]|uniref:alkaline phosphatase D family protein n=1 Tax=Candidatus Laterigemmans baculatus TaxID=2770505 RepID=UPI0013DA227F|nr:alkaline phosphatase D family protein [Candidatus Laterigemmans baculatus]
MLSRSLPRRRFLLGSASLAGAAWMSGKALGAVRSDVSFADYPFKLGVASGDPDDNGFVIWTRLAPKPLEGGGMSDHAVAVDWEVSEDESFGKVARRGTFDATVALGHSVHVEVVGLEPDRWYFYRFHAGGETSPVGRARTFPAADVMPEKLRFAFASCQHFETGHFTALRHMADEGLDLGIHLGDYIYEYAGKDGRVRKHVGEEIESLDDYRNRLAQYRTDEHLQAVHAAMPWLVTWDDHEFDNNCAGDISEQEGVTPAEFLRRREAAYQAYYEHMPLRISALPKGPHMRLYRSTAFGQLANFSVLDTRQYRTDQPNGDHLKPLEGGVFRSDAEMLGAAQERWLRKDLARSTAQWNVLAQQVMMARVDRTVGEERKFSMDQWAGYELPRRRLLSYLAEQRISNPVVLTGDIHSNWVNDLKLDFDDANAPTVATEFVGTSITSGGDGRDQAPETPQLLDENPFVKFYNAQRGYVRCTVTPDAWTSDFQIVPYVTRPGAPLETRATFEVQAGRPGAEQAG